MALQQITDWLLIGTAAELAAHPLGAPRTGGQVPRAFIQTDSTGDGEGVYVDDGVSGVWIQKASLGSGAGSAITALTGDVTATGPGSAAATIANSAVTNAKVATGIDAAKLADGSVSNTEFQYLNGVTGALQGQLDNKQPLDPELSAIAGLSSAADKVPYFTGVGAADLATLTAAGRALIDDADAAAQRTTLGLGTVATLASDTDGTLAANSDSRVATQKATKTYVDNAVTGLLDFKGSTDASSNPNYPAASKGDAYIVSVAGKIGGASGKSVDVGDVYVASADNAGGTEASVGTSWFVLEHNLQGVALQSTTLTINGTTNQVSVSGGTQDLSTNRSWTISLPQNIHTGATPQWLQLGLGVAAGAAVLNLASTTQLIGRVRLSGQEFFQAGNTSTDGIELRLGVNRSGERQLWIADSALAVDNSNPQFRMRVSAGAGFSAIDAISTDGSTPLKMAINSIGGNVSVGNIGVTMPLAQLDVRGGGLRVNGALGAAAVGANVMGLDHQGGGQARFISYGVDNSTPGKLIFHQSSANNTVFRNAIYVDTNGHVGFGDVIPGASAAVQIDSTTGAFLPPRMTTTQRDALTPSAGMMIFNTTVAKHQGYDGTTWQNYY